MGGLFSGWFFIRRFNVFYMSRVRQRFVQTGQSIGCCLTFVRTARSGFFVLFSVSVSEQRQLRIATIKDPSVLNKCVLLCVFLFFYNEHLPRASTRDEPEMLHKATLDQKRQPSNHTQILHQSTIMIIKINCASFFRKTTTTTKQLNHFFKKNN